MFGFHRPALLIINVRGYVEYILEYLGGSKLHPMAQTTMAIKIRGSASRLIHKEWSTVTVEVTLAKSGRASWLGLQ